MSGGRSSRNMYAVSAISASVELPVGRALDADARRRGTRGRPPPPRACRAAMRRIFVLQLRGRARHGARDHHRVARAARPGARQRVLRVGVRDDDRRRGRRRTPRPRPARRRSRGCCPTATASAASRRCCPVGSICRLALSGLEVGVNSRLVEPEPELGRAEDAALLRGDDADADVPALGARLLPVGDPVVVVDLAPGPSPARPGSCRCRRCCRSACVRELVGRRAGCAGGSRRGPCRDRAPPGRRAAPASSSRPRPRSRGTRPAGSCSSAPRQSEYSTCWMLP